MIQNRKIIRDEVRRVLQKNLNINRFSARTSPLEPEDFPVAVVYFPSERVIDDKDIYSERELELRVEVGVIPRQDPEDEIYSLSDMLEKCLLESKELDAVLRRIDLVSIDFVVDGEGKDIVAAAQHTYRINYLAPRSGALSLAKPVA